MRSGVLATATVFAVLAAGTAVAQVPDLPPINEGSSDGAPQDRLYPGELGTPPLDPAPLDTAPATPAPYDPSLAQPAPAPVPAVPAGPPIDVDRVMDRVKTCWTRIPKVYGTEAQGGVARIRLKFQPNGMLDGAPMIIDKPQGAIGAKFAESAAEAIGKCQPYQLPPDRYGEWRLIEMRFDTIDPDNPPPPPPAPVLQAPAAGAVQSGGTLQDLPPAGPADGYVPSVPAPGQ